MADKFGWLTNRSGVLPRQWCVGLNRASAEFVSPIRNIAALLLALLAQPAAARGTVIEASGAWAAIDYGTACEVRARSVRVASKGKVQATAGFAFSADHRRWGEFGARLSRVPRAGSSVMLTIGGRQFLLAALGDWAWSRGPAQEQAMIAMSRTAQAMRVEGRDQAGRRFHDDYSLAGAPTAIDAAAARCAGKIARP